MQPAECWYKAMLCQKRNYLITIFFIINIHVILLEFELVLPVYFAESCTLPFTYSLFSVLPRL